LKLPRTVWALAAVSLLNDAASEMIAPLLPLFLTLTLGAGPAIVALVEGLADALTSVLKLFAGRWADRGISAKRLIVGGYGIANLARPLMGLATTWGMVLALRLADRVGKGLRSAPRDALLAASVPAEHRGRAFGVHRAADHFGAVIGPIVATVLLLAGVPLRTVFLIGAVFGVLVMLTLWRGLPEETPAPSVGERTPWRWGSLDLSVRTLLLAVATLTAFAVPEVLVVLWATERGLAVVWVPLMWAAAHALKAGVAWPAGILVDRLGPMRVLALGWPARVLALATLALLQGPVAAVAVAFAFYSVTLALTEAAERTLVAAKVPAEARGAAFGWFHFMTGIAAIPGALLLGLLWQFQGASVALSVAAAGSALACLGIVTISSDAAPRAR
jgi:MFS family permease